MAGTGGKQRGIRLRWMMILMAVLAGLLTALLFLLSSQTLKAFRVMREASDRYVTAQKAAADMQDASGYLTDRVRTFVATGDVSAMNDFFVEVNETRRRDNARSAIEAIQAGDEAVGYLEEALRWSNDLVQIEYRAMRLAADVYGVSLEGYPALRKLELTEAERGMSSEGKLTYALSLLFDENYREMKRQITDNVHACEDAMLSEMSSRQEQSVKRFQRLLMVEAVLIAAEMLLSFSIMLSVRLLLILPMQEVVAAIGEKRTVSVHRGAYELRFLSRAYNTMFEQLDRQREELFYRASHDPLTGLYNRSVFDKVRSQSNRRAQAMILADVDSFKTFNDTYGHSIGDQVLQKVAKSLLSNFRSEDYVCRIGGDEFAIIMVHADSSLKDLVQGKLENAAAMLRDTSDGLPMITLSIGVAFSDRNDPGEDIYKDADAVLYRVKEQGHDGIAFY